MLCFARNLSPQSSLLGCERLLKRIYSCVLYIVYDDPATKLILITGKHSAAFVFCSTAV